MVMEDVSNEELVFDTVQVVFEMTWTKLEDRKEERETKLQLKSAEIRRKWKH